MRTAEFDSTLEKYAIRVNERIEKYIPRTGTPALLYRPMWELLDRGGKRFRPALTFLFCEAVGGRAREALSAAAAVEILHNMTLVHDDIEDQSELRRGKPCIHILFGLPAAINSGDAMLIKVFEAAGDGPLDPATKNRLIERFADRAFRITRGQALEFELNNRQDFTDADVIEVLRNKTGALVALACEAGAIVGGATKKQLSAATAFGESAGVGFQIVDDILNVSGEVQKYGKETIMAAHLMKSAPLGNRNRFNSLLGKSNVTQQEISDAIDMYKEYGSLDYAKRMASRYMETALRALNNLPKSKARALLVTLAEFLVRREF